MPFTPDAEADEWLNEVRTEQRSKIKTQRSKINSFQNILNLTALILIDDTKSSAMVDQLAILSRWVR